MARLSSGVMIVLGSISTLFAIRHPLSPAFFVSVAVLAIGIIEWRAGNALRALDEKAPGRLAVNQTALGIVIAIYALCQVQVLNPEMIDGLLRGRTIAPILDAYPPDLVIQVRAMLPRLVRLFYYLVGTVALLGCLGTAWFYHSRLRHVLVAKSIPPAD